MGRVVQLRTEVLGDFAFVDILCVTLTDGLVILKVWQPVTSKHITQLRKERRATRIIVRHKCSLECDIQGCNFIHHLISFQSFRGTWISQVYFWIINVFIENVTISFHMVIVCHRIERIMNKAACYTALLARLVSLVNACYTTSYFRLREMRVSCSQLPCSFDVISTGAVLAHRKKWGLRSY